jgi:leucyl aminopeptidase
LQEFVGDSAWAHLDIAGTAWSEGTPRPYESHGATGVGVRLLLHMLESWTD